MPKRQTYANITADEWITVAKKHNYRIDVGLQDANEPMMEAYDGVELRGAWYMPNRGLKSYVCEPYNFNCVDDVLAYAREHDLDR